MKSKKKRRSALKVLLLLMVLVLVCEGCLMLAVFAGGELPRKLAPSDAIIVLGARVMEDGHLSTTLQFRMEKALEVYNQGYAAFIITCGGQGSNEPKAEADAMAEYLIANGVPKDKVLRETRSTDTFQNLKNAKAMMDDKGMGSAIVVTSDYHITRALWIARDAGIKKLSGAASLGQRYQRNRVKATFRETLSWINYWTGGLLGRVSGLSESGDEA